MDRWIDYIYDLIPEVRTANRTVWWSSFCRFPALPLLIVIVDLGDITIGLSEEFAGSNQRKFGNSGF